MTDEERGASARVRLARAADGGGADDVIVGRATSILDRIDAPLVRSGVIAAALFGVVDMHATLSHPFYFAADVALRILAATSAIRFAVRIIRLVMKQAHEGDPKRHAIVIDDDALVLIDGPHTRVLTRDRVAAVVEDPPRVDDVGSVSLIVRGDGPCIEVLPEALARPAAATARRLERFVGPIVLPKAFVHPEPNKDPTATFDAAKSGEAPRGTTAMLRTRGWLLQGPYAGLVIVLVLVFRAVTGNLVFDAPLAAAATLCLALPGVWITRGMRMRRSRYAFVATPAELLVRSLGGVHRFPWADVVRVDTIERATWNVLTGLTKSRAVVIERGDGMSLLFDERELPVAAYHVRALFEAYLDGLVPGPASASGTPPSHGTAAGGGISGDAGTSTNASILASPDVSTTGDAHDAP